MTEGVNSQKMTQQREKFNFLLLKTALHPDFSPCLFTVCVAKHYYFLL